MASPPPPSVLREFCPLYYLLNNIPAKVQRGFRSVVVYLTALDLSKDYVALGSSIGMLYLYCRQAKHMNKYSLESKSDTVTSVKLLSCFDDLVAVGTASGRVAILQLVSPLPGRNKQLRRFDVIGHHRGSVTSLAWSSNGMKLFSADDRGRVVFSSLDLDQGVCVPVLLMEEPCAVVQMDYSHQMLLVSTQHRSLLYCTQKNTTQLLGAEPRASGRYGACFLPALCKVSDVQVYGAQSALSLIRTDVNGTVMENRHLAHLFHSPAPELRLFPRPCPMGALRAADRQLGLVSCFHGDGWLLSWNEYSLYVIDPANQVLIGALESSGDIVSVSCHDDEIFILKGDRDIIRLSTAPEGHANTLSSPLAPPPTMLLPPIGSVETAQPIRTIPIILDEETTEEGSGLAVSRSRSSSVTSCDSLHGNNSPPVTASCEVTPKRYSAPIGQLDLQQQLVVKAIRVKKKKKRTDSSSSVSRLSESSCGSEAAIFVVQDDACSETGSDQTSVSCLDLQSNQQSPETHQEPHVEPHIHMDKDCEASSNQPCSAPPDPLLLGDQDTDVKEEGCDEERERKEEEGCDEEIKEEEGGGGFSVSPDVDLLLECSFSYQSNTEPMTEQDTEEQQPMTEQDTELLTPLIGPEEEEEEEEEDLLAPPGGQMEQMFFSTMSNQEPEEREEKEREERESERRRRESVSSEEDPSIYHPSEPHTHTWPADRHTDRKSDDEEDLQCESMDTHTPDQHAEIWMGYSGPGCGILSLQVTDRYVWCLDFKGSLFVSPLPDSGLKWNKFEENVHQMALSPSGNLLWKVEQKTMTAYACAQVCFGGKRHWYLTTEHTAAVALSDDSAWIIKTNGELYLQTGLSVERPCSRSIPIDCPCVFLQLCVCGAVWALSEHRALYYRTGLSAFCSEGEGWRCDTVSESQGLDVVCISLSNGTLWALDTGGSLWFRTGVSQSKPQGEDDHWWQICISDYVVYDQGSLFQTLLAGAQSVATVTVAFLSQVSSAQPSLLSANASSDANANGVWVASGRNQIHRARGALVGTFWQNLVPRGTVSSTRWSFITSSEVPNKEGTFLWLAQSRKDVFCVWDQDGELRPSTVPLPNEMELSHLSACLSALWLLDSHGRVSIRTLTASCPAGLDWTPLDLSQLGNVRLVCVCVGSQNVWAIDSRGSVYFRVGTQPLNPNMMLPAWITIDPPIQPMGVQLVSIVTSPNDRLLWALDNRGNVFVRAGLSLLLPVGTHWETVPGLCVSQLALSHRCVWGRCGNGDIARRFGVTDRNPAGDYWKKIPGKAHWLTVTPGDVLWSVTSSGGLSRRLTKLLPQSQPDQSQRSNPKPPPHSNPMKQATPTHTHTHTGTHAHTGSNMEDTEEEWELL